MLVRKSAVAALLFLKGKTPWEIIQIITNSADHNDQLEGKVFPDGGVLNPNRALNGVTFESQTLPPIELKIKKVKPGKIVGTTSDPSKEMFVMGHPEDINVKMDIFGGYTIKIREFRPVLIASPLGGAVAEK